ncbi:MAG: translation initiation factor IF-2 [Bdellovibrionales bacterium]|nr:translation initiation factor IF-2 [Bdellovibrionales bacterium]
MTDREPLKVYELAKELGIDSISLVDKLKGLDINVKNHMSELTDGDAEKARNVLKVGTTTVGAETASGGTKKTVTRKASGAGATAATKTPTKTVTKTSSKPAAKAAAPLPEAAAAPSATPAAKPVRKRTTATTAAKDSASATPAASPSSAAPTAGAETSSSSSTVIRRRVLSDGATQTVTSTISTVTGTEKEAKAPEAPQTLETAPEVLEEIVTPPTATETLAPPPAVPAEPEAPKPSIKTSSDGNRVETVRTEVKTEGGKTTTSVIRRTETTLTTYSLKDSLGKRPGGLRIIEQAKPEPAKSAGDKAGAAGATAAKGSFKSDRDGFKFARVDKENLDRMAEEEARKRGPKAFDAVIKPEDVKFSDYRKKEMIFIPKKKKAPVGKDVKKTEITVAAAHKRVVEMGDTIKVSDFAQQMSVKSGDVIKKLMSMGTMATMNQSIDFDTASIIAQEFQFEVKNIAFREDEVLETTEEKAEDLLPRPPVVTIMGHVDHGKTTLLDSIREANVAAGEAGGITQHIGAYTIEKDGKLITFIDTPGHEAFTSMRARGANVTDIVILVVSADDGVMPQTREALSHAKAAEVPIIVAVNKIDKPGANPEKIKQALAELDLLAEDWGGETIYVPVSALKKTNIDKLLESILLVAEVQDLKASQKGLMRGVVLESRVEKGRGPVASVLVNRGILKIGDLVVSGTQWGRVKAMTNHLGESVKEVAPGMAAELLGLDGVPNAGEPIDSVKDEKAATTLVDHRTAQARDKKQMSSKASMEDLFARAQAGELKELRVVLKADVFGSVEAVKESLIKQSTDKVKVKVIHSAAGGITESDVMLANASNAIIIGFNVRPETKARSLAEAEHIEIKCYNIIYELIDDVKLAMAGLLDKKRVETYLGRAEVRQTFSIPKAGTVAGCFVIDGKLVRNAQVRLLRDSRIIFDGKLNSLKRFKDDAKEVNQGYECGMGIDGYNDIKVGDLIEAYQIDMVAQEL